MNDRTPPSRIVGPALAGLTLALAALTAFAAPAHAQEDDGDSPWAIGIQSSVNTYGPSIRYQLTEKFAAQAVLSAGALLGVTGRGNYDFQDNDKYDIFGYGSVSLWRWTGIISSESAVGFGVGGGVEFDFPELLEDDEIPPIFATLELGFGTTTFNTYSYSGFRYGGSLHYRF